MHTPLIAGLNGEKMSSSKGNNIAVDEPAEDVEKKIKSAFLSGQGGGEQSGAGHMQVPRLPQD